MPNILRGEADFTASDGATYHLVMDFAAYVEATDAAKMDVEALMEAVTPVIDTETGAFIRKPSVKHLGALLYGGLTENHPGITLRQALNLLGDCEAAGEALAKAIEASMPKQEPSAEGNARSAALSGTGTAPSKTG